MQHNIKHAPQACHIKKTRENAYMQYWDFSPHKVKCSIFTPFSHDTKEAQSCRDSNMNQGQLTHSQLQLDLTGTPVKAETGFSIQMGERVGQTDSPARLNADRLPSAVRTKGMKMTTLPKLATDETCTAEWPWCTAPICLCVQVLHYMWQKSPAHYTIDIMSQLYIWEYLQFFFALWNHSVHEICLHVLYFVFVLV